MHAAKKGSSLSKQGSVASSGCMHCSRLKGIVRSCAGMPRHCPGDLTVRVLYGTLLITICNSKQSDLQSYLLSPIYFINLELIVGLKRAGDLQDCNFSAWKCKVVYSNVKLQVVLPPFQKSFIQQK